MLLAVNAKASILREYVTRQSHKNMSIREALIRPVVSTRDSETHKSEKFFISWFKKITQQEGYYAIDISIELAKTWRDEHLPNNAKLLKGFWQKDNRRWVAESITEDEHVFPQNYLALFMYMNRRQ